MTRLAALFLCALLFLSSAWAANERTRRTCGTKAKVDRTAYKDGSDCGPTQSVISAEYNPGDVLTITVVVHVITTSDGTGDISADLVDSQIEVLNQDFRAIAGSPGSSGTDAGIQFVLADKDPDGNPHSGMTLTANDEWFADETDESRIAMGQALNWDPSRYLNIFTNSGGGSLGYVINMPWTSNPDPNMEGVVVAHDAFGIRPEQEITSLGRTTTHEVGHYLGLEHTFGVEDASCPTGDCYTTGDLICDTNPHFNADYGCEDYMECELPNPIHNYMNYTDDVCMSEFTPEQVNRMRCSILNFRSDLIQVDEPPITPDDLETRWVPHLTAIGAGFSTKVLFANSSNSSATVTLNGYDATGGFVASEDVSVTRSGLTYDLSSDLFSDASITHFGITGSDSVLVSASYKANSSDAASAHFHESTETGTSFMLYQGERDLVFDGIVIINLGSEAANVTAVALNDSGSEVFSKTLNGSLPVRGKFLDILNDFPDDDGTRIIINSTQPITVLALRGTWLGASPAFLYVNKVKKLQ